MDQEETRDWERLCELIWGCAISQAIHVCAELEIFERLDELGPLRADELAARIDGDAWALETVLRTLHAHGVLERDHDEAYGLARMGRLLLTSAPGPSAGEAREFYETLYRSLGALKAMVKNGGVAFDHVYGKSFYAHLSERPTLAAHFYDSMQGNSRARYAGVSAVVDIASATCVVDVGGAEGSLLVQLLHEHPQLRGVLFDLPAVSDRGRATLEEAGLSHRSSVVAGDFLKSVPSGGDLYLLAQVMNNWRDEDARRILLNCREAMSDGARLVILEPVLREADTTPRWRALVSLGVMAQRGGRTRSERQMRALLASAGFSVVALARLPGSATCAITVRPGTDPSAQSKVQAAPGLP